MTTTIDPRPPSPSPGPAPAGSPATGTPGVAPDAPLPTRALRLRRTSRHGGDPYWQRVEVPVPSARTTILDALTWVRRRLDPTLDVRHSCFHASCGTCGMRVAGRDVLACVTRLADVRGDEITVEPLRNQPVVSDLVTDLEALYEALEPLGLPLVRHSELIEASQPAPGVEDATRFEDCIECGLCVSACPVEATDAAYRGPAVLGAAWRVVEEPRGADPETAMALVDGDQGAWRCHLAFECSEACPSDGLPGERIMRLRRRLIRHRLQALFRNRRASTGGA